MPSLALDDNNAIARRFTSRVRACAVGEPVAVIVFVAAVYLNKPGTHDTALISFALVALVSALLAQAQQLFWAEQGHPKSARYWQDVAWAAILIIPLAHLSPLAIEGLAGFLSRTGAPVATSAGVGVSTLEGAMNGTVAGAALAGPEGLSTRQGLEPEGLYFLGLDAYAGAVMWREDEYRTSGSLKPLRRILLEMLMGLLSGMWFWLIAPAVFFWRGLCSINSPGYTYPPPSSPSPSSSGFTATQPNGATSLDGAVSIPILIEFDEDDSSRDNGNPVMGEHAREDGHPAFSRSASALQGHHLQPPSSAPPAYLASLLHPPAYCSHNSPPPPPYGLSLSSDARLRLLPL
ncbi:hypothetical protein JCM10213_004157 [Rhodosporidiobolus nylandii]